LPTPTPPPLIPPPPPGAVVAFNSIHGSYLLDSVNQRWYQNDTDIPAGDQPTAIGTGKLGDVDLWKTTVGNIHITHNAKQRFASKQWFTPATWIEKKPGDPPGGDVDLVNFTWLSVDRTNTSKALALATQEISGEWNSWMGYTTDFGDSWAWTQIGGALTGAASWANDPFYHEGASLAVPELIQLNVSQSSYSVGGGQGNPRSIAKFDDKYAGFFYQDDEQFELRARVAEVDFSAGGSVTTGSHVFLATTTGGPASSEGDRWTVAAVSDRDMLVLTSVLHQDIGGSYDLHLVNFRKQASNRVIAQVSDVLISSSVTGPIRDINIAKTDDREGIIGYGISHLGMYGVFTVDGAGNIFMGPQRTFVSNAILDNASMTANTRVAGLGDGWYVVTSSDGSGRLGTDTTDDGGPGTNYYCAWLIDAQGASPVNYGPYILPGSITTQPGVTDLIKVSENKFAVSYVDQNGAPNPEDAHFVVGERSGSTINWGSSRRIKHFWNGTLFEIDSNNVGLCHQWDTTGSEFGPHIGVAEISGTSADIKTSSGLGDTGYRTLFPVAMSMSANKILLADDGVDSNLLYGTGQLDVQSSGETKAQGAVLSWNGNQAFVTYSNGTDQILGVYSVPGFTETRTANLGAGTVAQIDSGTVSAYPHVARGRDSSDATVHLFGRMTTVPDIGVLTHVARSTNSGANFTAVETGWGTDHAAGLAKDWNGFGYNAIRNLGTGGAAYYRGNNNLFIINTLPYHVDPRGFTITSDGYLVAGASGTAGGIRLGYTAPGLPLWYDFSYDFPTNGTVTGVAVI
jgi:hypothetical protein